MTKKQEKEDIPGAWLEHLADQQWRLEHLYWIENKTGNLQRFRMNSAQRRLHANLWFRNDVLKARQLGISTYAALLMLDMCLFRSNFHCGIIDKTLPDARQKLSKIRFAWDHLDYMPQDGNEEELILSRLGECVKERTGISGKSGWKLPVDTRTELGLSNGSDIRIGTNLRGGTIQFLHVSELAHVSVHAPWRARDIRTGAINTVPSGGYILKESTHEGGRFGVNYELTRQAMENNAKEELSPLDFRFFFFSWFDHEGYALSGKERWNKDLDIYFTELETKHGIRLDADRKRWYARMNRVMGRAMKQEYPSTPQEAFLSGEEGSIYGSVMAAIRERGQIGVVCEGDRKDPMFTSWDLGLSDHTAIWLVRLAGGKLYWLDHYACNQQGIAHYAEKMKVWEKAYGPVVWHFLPHDASKRDAHGQSYVENLAREGIERVRVVPRTTDIWLGINSLRELLESSFFHERTLARPVNIKGESEPSALEHLELYHSRPPGVSGTLREEPVHDEHSHTADAARTLAEAWSHGFMTSISPGTVGRRRARMR